jgi:L-arabinokinase
MKLAHILYYITGHGFGHGMRSTVIANALPPSVKITFRTSLPESFFRDEMHRSYSWYKGSFDCGCVQVDGVTVDIPKTLNTYKQIADRNRMLLDSEVAWCKTNQVSCILGDITPFAFDIGAKAGIPSIALSNFTWYDIYREYVSDNNEFSPYLEEILHQYNKADLFLAMFPSNPIDYVKNRVDVSLIGRKGISIRDQIAEKYGFSPKKNIGLIYIGCYGLNNISWERLRSLNNWEFLSLYDIENRPPNFHLIDKGCFKYQDLTASADVVISKPGYGVVSECFLNRIPLLYIPRRDFAEYPVLKEAIDSWGGGYQISDHELFTCQWGELLDMVKDKKKQLPINSSGVTTCVHEIMKMISKHERGTM